MKRHIALAVIVLAAAATAGCGTDSSDDEASAAAEKPAAPKNVEIGQISEDGNTVEGKTTPITGSVKPASSAVKVEGKQVKVSAVGEFETRVRLPYAGKNLIVVTATRRGYKPDNFTATIDRDLTAQERATRAEKRRQKREAAIATLRATATELDPGLFQKNPDEYAGQKVVMRGEVFQIQEGGENFLLMNTECETEYDVTICNGPEVYVSYDFGTDAKEESIVTVYGTVVGGKDYETSIGGSNYVGEINAKIIE